MDWFDGLLSDYVKRKGAKIIVRGLRAVSDFDYELQMALTLKKLAPDVETVFMMTNSKYIYLSSSIIKESSRLWWLHSVWSLDNVEAALRRKFKRG